MSDSRGVVHIRRKLEEGIQFQLEAALSVGDMRWILEYIDAVEGIISLPPSSPTPGMQWPEPLHVRRDHAEKARRRFSILRSTVVGAAAAPSIAQGYRSDGSPITPWGDGNGPCRESGGGANGAA